MATISIKQVSSVLQQKDNFIEIVLYSNDAFNILKNNVVYKNKWGQLPSHIKADDIECIRFIDHIVPTNITNHLVVMFVLKKNDGILLYGLWNEYDNDLFDEIGFWITKDEVSLENVNKEHTYTGSNLIKFCEIHMKDYDITKKLKKLSIKKHLLEKIDNNKSNNLVQFTKKYLIVNDGEYEIEIN